MILVDPVESKFSKNKDIEQDRHVKHLSQGGVDVD